jgi:hypothetical protein
MQTNFDDYDDFEPDVNHHRPARKAPHYKRRENARSNYHRKPADYRHWSIADWRDIDADDLYT